MFRILRGVSSYCPNVSARQCFAQQIRAFASLVSHSKIVAKSIDAPKGIENSELECFRVHKSGEALSLYMVPSFNDNYIFMFKLGGASFCVDPGESAVVLDFMYRMKWDSLDFILTTHTHQDHIGGVDSLTEATGALLVSSASHKDVFDMKTPLGLIMSPNRVTRPGKGCRATAEDAALVDRLIRVIDTPGHTKEHCSFFLPQAEWLFCGDVLFSMGCGRVFTGDMEQMHESLLKLAELPDDTLVCCAHEYTLVNGEFAQTVLPYNNELATRICKEIDRREQGVPTVPSTLSVEKKTNPFLTPDALASVDVFRERRLQKDVF